MTDLTSKIAALPEWPDSRDYVNGRGITRWEHIIGLREAQRDAALARLALAREWIEGTAFQGHHWICEIRSVPGRESCTCGRDALLKALEVPR